MLHAQASGSHALPSEGKGIPFQFHILKWLRWLRGCKRDATRDTQAMHRVKRLSGAGVQVQASKACYDNDFGTRHNRKDIRSR